MLAKPFFEPEGLIIAVDGDEPIGFVHAGFAPDPLTCEWNTSIGATCMLVVSDQQRGAEIGAELLDRSERFLQQRGAEQLYGGGTLMTAPFYLGLYGGAALSGVLATDTAQLDVYKSAGYTEVGRKLIMQRQLVSFRPAVDRQLMQLKRNSSIDPAHDPNCASWWEACTIGLTDRYTYEVKSRASGDVCATAVFWDMEPLASAWGLHARGLCDLKVEVAQERELIALFTLGEVLRQMSAGGVTVAEVHIDAADDPLLPVLSRLGFQEIEQCLVLKK